MAHGVDSLNVAAASAVAFGSFLKDKIFYIRYIEGIKQKYELKF